MTSVLDSILAVFSAVGEWIATAVQSFVPMFYVPETGLTFLGVLAVISVAIGMAFLILRVLQNFLGFRS